MVASESSQSTTSSSYVQTQQMSEEMLVAQALETARENSDGLSDLSTAQIISAAYQGIWAKIRAQPNSYTMTTGEFAVFNFLQHLHKGHPDLELMARDATARFWTQTHAPDSRSP